MSNLRIVLSTCVLSVGLLFSTFASAQTVFEELSTARDRINFPELTTEEKRIVAEQAQVLLAGVYVHRFQKQDFYPGVTDPAVAIQEVVDNIDSLTVAEMEEQIYEIFASQRDLHLNYIFPQPYASAQTFLPLNFTRTKGRRNFFEVRVDSVNAEQFAEFAPDQRVPEVGDQVISYNGQRITKAVEGLFTVGQGANRFGGFSRGVTRLTFRPQLLNLLPEEDSVTIGFRSAKRNNRGRFEKYEIELNWITATPEPTPAPAEIRSSAAAQSPSIQQKPRKLTREMMMQGEDIFQKEYAKFRKANDLMPLSMFPENDSNEPVLKWGIIENRLGKFGYLRLDSFVPASQDPDATIAEIRRLIFEEFGDTRGLMFDVRNNGGGFLDLADKLPQLFTPGDAVNANGRLINTPTNFEIYNNPASLFSVVFPELAQATMDVAGTDATHTIPLDFNTPESVNLLGQLYNGPVAVLANARSYSASDYFACQMQDSGAAFVFGEEPRTGAGGANVREQSVYAQFGPPEFQPLPAGHRMRVSERQNIRKGRNAGAFIEDFGCKADLLISPTKSDMSNGNERQINTITRALKFLSFFPRYRSSVVAPSNETLLTRTLDNLDFPITVRNTPLVRVSVNGEVVDEIYTYGFGTRTVPVVFPSDLAVGTTSNILIEGISYRGTRKWNLKRQILVLEDVVVVGDEGLEIDFSSPGFGGGDSASPFSIINQNPAELGWNLVSPSLEVGFNPTYANNVNTDALLLLDLSSRTSAQVSFDLEFDTEVDFDFIEVFVNDSEGNNQLLLSSSGTNPTDEDDNVITSFAFDISNFAGRSDVELHFNFISDGSVVAPGVKLQRVSIGDLAPAPVDPTPVIE